MSRSLTTTPRTDVSRRRTMKFLMSMSALPCTVSVITQLLGVTHPHVAFGVSVRVYMPSLMFVKPNMPFVSVVSENAAVPWIVPPTGARRTIRPEAPVLSDAFTRPLTWPFVYLKPKVAHSARLSAPSGHTMVFGVPPLRSPRNGVVVVPGTLSVSRVSFSTTWVATSDRARTV